MEFPTIDKFAKEVAEKALDEITYEGKTVREWVEIIVNQQQSEDCRNCKKWNECPCGKEGHENGTSIGYSIGECKDYEPSEDCVSRQAVIEYITADYGFCHNLIDWVKDLPPVTPQRPKGKWIMFDDEANAYCCNQCNEVFYLEYGNPKNNGYRYCPNCGAKMDGDTKTEDNRNEIRMKSEWIPVSERLPEDGQKVLVTKRSGYIIDVDTSIFYHASAFWKNYVIAWMPLPEPYKEVQNDIR